MDKLRFVMAIGALLVVALLAAGILFYGDKLTQPQIVLLTLLATALAGEVKTAAAFIFDGVPDKRGGADPTQPDKPAQP